MLNGGDYFKIVVEKLQKIYFIIFNYVSKVLFVIKKYYKYLIPLNEYIFISTHNMRFRLYVDIKIYMIDEKRL